MAFVVTAVEAVGAAIIETTAASVLTAVSSVGAAMTVVGAVTGSKDLMKVGGVLGLVGGVGSFATKAFGEATNAAADGWISAEGGAGYAADAENGIAAADGLGDAVQTSSVANPESGIVDTTGASPSDAWDKIVNNKGGIVGQAQTSTPSTTNSSAVPGTTNGPAGNGGTFNDTAYGASKGIDPTLSTPYDKFGGPLDSIKKTLGSAWDKLSPQAQAEITKSILAIPGGIQSQKNKEHELDLLQQRANQTSYGSQVPTFGIINKARTG